MKKQHDETIKTDDNDKFQQRREFLKKSALVAYSTPVLMSLFVENASAAGSVPLTNPIQTNSPTTGGGTFINPFNPPNPPSTPLPTFGGFAPNDGN